MKKRKKNHKRQNNILFFSLVILLAGIILFCLWQNNSLVVSHYEYRNSQIPTAFDGYRIVQVSDLHNKEFGDRNETLLARIREQRPDVIFVTGDLIDRRFTKLEVAVDFVEQAVGIAPVYFVSGNHEGWSGKEAELRTRLEEAGVMVMDDRAVELRKDGASIRLLGLADPDVIDRQGEKKTDGFGFIETLEELAQGEDFSILLSHRPELIQLYALHGVDLVFSGHAHGGQVRLFGRALFAPHQGFLPEYTAGKYSEGSTTLFVSRGLGNSIVPVRVFNRPEVVVVTLFSSE